MKAATKTRKAEKVVNIIARIEFKADPRKVVYLVRSSDGTKEYQTCLFDGNATSCNCPSTSPRPCYHMTQLEAKEAARAERNTDEIAAVQEMTAEERTEAVAAFAQLFTLYHANHHDAYSFDEARICVENLHADAVAHARANGYWSEAIALAKQMRIDAISAKKRESAPLYGNSRGFSLMR